MKHDARFPYRGTLAEEKKREVTLLLEGLNGELTISTS